MAVGRQHRWKAVEERRTRLILGDDSNLEIELRGNHLAHPPDPLCPVENIFFGNVLFCSREGLVDNS